MTRKSQTNPPPAGGGDNRDRFRADVLEGLTRTPKSLPPKYFYDSRGSALFEQICELPEYYLTRTELEIMRRHAVDMATMLGPNCLLIELGSGSSRKTRLLLDVLVDPAAYVPVDISADHLQASARRLTEEYPTVPVLPVHADFSAAFSVPEPPRPASRRAVYFPGSTIGNFDETASERLLHGMAGLVEPGGGLLVGADLRKDPSILEAAYDDSQGVTAAFNLNLLHRIRSELGVPVDVDRFAHRARYDAERGRIEMHLESLSDQSFRIGDRVITFDRGETIHTENSYKYDIEQFRAMAARAGFVRDGLWTDDRRWFSVQLFSVEG